MSQLVFSFIPTDLDPIECNANSSIEVETGTNLSITCTAKSSRPLYYTWIRVRADERMLLVI